MNESNQILYVIITVLATLIGVGVVGLGIGLIIKLKIAFQIYVDTIKATQKEVERVSLQIKELKILIINNPITEQSIWDSKKGLAEARERIDQGDFSIVEFLPEYIQDLPPLDQIREIDKRQVDLSGIN